MCNEISSYVALNYTYHSIIGTVKTTLAVYTTWTHKMSDFHEQLVMMAVRKMP